MVLKDGKTLIMPTPRIKQGFLLIDPRKLDRRSISEASSISGAFRFGEKTHPRDLPTIELMVVGSVAVSPSGWRIGKGEGYSEIEYAILREYRKITDDVPVVTTVHDLQVVDEIHPQPFDLPVDRIYTNTRVVNCPSNPRPAAIFWHHLSRDKIESIPLLKELMENTF